jgi:glycerol-3-phosphate O-acyltransferase
MSLLNIDFFLWQDQAVINEQVSQVLECLKQQDLVKQSKAGYWSVNQQQMALSQVKLLGECIDETLQRLIIIASLVTRLGPITKAELELKVVAIAKRLSVLNNIHAPEFIDLKAQASLINEMKKQHYISLDEQGLLIAHDSLNTLKTVLTELVDISILQSIAR